MMPVMVPRMAPIAPDVRGRIPSLDVPPLALPETGRPRRVTGLRREKAAQLANTSTDHYTRPRRGPHAGTRIIGRPRPGPEPG
jgi:hypothetical protein